MNDGRTERVCSIHDSTQYPRVATKDRAAVGIVARVCVMVEEDWVDQRIRRAKLRTGRQIAACCRGIGSSACYSDTTFDLGCLIANYMRSRGIDAPT